MLDEQVHYPTLAQIPEHHRGARIDSCKRYLRLIGEEDSDDARVVALRELDTGFEDFGSPPGTGRAWVLEVVALAATAAREQATTKPQLLAACAAFDELGASVRQDALRVGESEAQSDHFAQDVAESVQAITTVLFALSNSGTPGEALRNVMDSIRTVFYWDYAAYWSLDGEAMRCTDQLDPLDSAFGAQSTQARLGAGAGPVGCCWSTADVVAQPTAEFAQDTRIARAIELGALHAVCVPIRAAERVTGVLEFLYRADTPISQAREDILRNLAVLVSASMERMLRADEMAAMAADAAAVSQVLHRLNAATNAIDAVSGSLEAVREAFDFEYGGFWRATAGSSLDLAGESGSLPDAFRSACARSRISTDAGLTGRACRRQAVEWCDDLPGADDPRAQAAAESGVRAALIMPLVSRGRVLGTLELFSLAPQALASGRLQALQSVCGAVSSTVQRLFERDVFSASLTDFVEELTDVSGALRATTSEQSASAQELATAVGEVTATLSELRETSSEALRNAEAVIGEAESAAQTSSSGRESVEHAIRSMRAIQDQVSEIAERILQLSDQTSQIGNIIATVNEISAQSKLLALNAAIEAARAGEHGRGFGVVASEISSLAEQSREATSQVREILGEIQAGTNAAVVSAEEGTKKAEAGMDLAETSGSKIQALSGSIEQSSDSAKLIANSSRQQNAGIEQVSQALISISNATNGTASGLKQTEQATAQLVTLAARMTELVEGLAAEAVGGSDAPYTSDPARAAE